MTFKSSMLGYNLGLRLGVGAKSAIRLKLRSTSCQSGFISCLNCLVYKNDSGFFSKPRLSFPRAKQVSRPELAKRCRFRTRSYLLARKFLPRFQRFLIFCFLSKTKTWPMNGCPASRLSLPFLTTTSIWAFGNCR